MSTVALNYLYTIIYQILTIMLPLITTPYISRVLKADNIGIYSYTYSIVQYFILISMLGISDQGNRSIAIHRDSPTKKVEAFWSIYIIQFVAGIVALIVYGFYTIYFATEYKLIFCIQSLSLIASVLDINWYFWGNEEFKLTVSRNIIVKLISTISIFVFVKSAEDLVIYVFVNAASTLVSNLILWFFLFREISFAHIHLADVIANLRPVFVLFVPLAARSVFVYMDKIMLGAFSTMTQVGYYENSERLIVVLTGILTSLGTVMLPRASLLVNSGNIMQLKRIIELSIQYIMLAGCAFAFGMAGIADTLAPLFFGEQFRPCGVIISFMSITIVLVGWTNVIRTQYLIPTKNERAYVISVVLGAIANFIINYLTVSRYGALGAVSGWIAAEIIITVYQTSAARKELPIMKYLKSTIIYVFAGGVMYLFIKNLRAVIVTPVYLLLAQIILGAVIYIALVFILSILTKNDFVFAIFPHKKGK